MVTARLSVLQYEKTLDTLYYIARKAPFHRENESASILAFLDSVHPDTREETLGGFRLNSRHNETLALPHAMAPLGGYAEPTDIEQPYERNESVIDDATE